MNSEKTPPLAPKGQKYIAVKLWKEWLFSYSYQKLDKWVAVRFKKERSFGSRDRRFYSDALFYWCRHLPFLLETEFSQESFQNFKDLQEKAKLVLDDTWILWLEERKTPQYSQESLHNFLFSYGFYPEFQKSLFLRKEYSRWNDSSFVSFIKNQVLQPPLWIRMKPLYANKVLAELQKEKFEYDVFENAACVKGQTSLLKLRSFEAGWFEIQDLGSQIAGSLIPVWENAHIWDVCAGAGGKTLQVAESLKKGILIASDVRESKLEELKNRCQRGGYQNVYALPWDGKTLPSFQKVISSCGFEVVFVDAPCSGTGTWRRNPDTMLHASYEQVQKMALLQKSILERVQETVKSQGYLVYLTCSWMVEENEMVVDEFLKKHQEFKLVSQQLCGNPEFNSDTLFVAVMKRD